MNKVKKISSKGNVSIIVCLMMTVILGFTAYVVDVGIVYSEKTKLTDAIDSAALAAAMELPNNSIKSKEIAVEYLVKNGVDPNDTVITISNNNDSIKIDGNKNVNHLFAKFIGINSSSVNSSTKAIIGPSKSVIGGIRPFAVQVYDFSYGSIVTLKEGAGDGYHGNYGAVALGGRGASVFKANALYGYSGTINVGDYIDTEPGNMSGAANSIENYINSEQSSFNDFPRDSIRVWTIPLVDSLQVNGRNQVLVVGFGEFYVENVEKDSGKIELTGRFIRYVRNSEIDMTLNDTGAYGIKLSK